jgi:hypothetical protein
MTLRVSDDRATNDIHGRAILTSGHKARVFAQPDQSLRGSGGQMWSNRGPAVVYPLGVSYAA